MSFQPKRNSFSINSSIAGTPKIPLQLALSLENEASKPVKATIPVQDECMLPTLVLNTSILIEQLQDPLKIEPGMIYFIVDNNLRGFLRRVSLMPDEDYLRLYCDNPDKDKWPSHLMRIASIRAIFKVSPTF
jgi:hypothetical protein